MSLMRQFRVFPSSTKVVVAALVSVAVLAGCAHVSLNTKAALKDGTKGAGNAPAGGGDKGAAAPAVPTSLTGDWEFGFQFNNDTLQSTVHINQNGNSFDGTGKDDQTGKEFAVENGTINGNQIDFEKKYTSGNSPVIQYSGTMEMSTDPSYNGPWLHGEYQTGSAGKIVSNIWEAEMTTKQSAAPAPAPASPLGFSLGGAPAPAPAASGGENGLLNKNPELSGKWNCGYEYNFKTIHSTMFLEQDGDRITGHGVDHDTHEKFTIDQGWYHFPKLTLIRKYPASKQSVPNAKGKGKHTANMPARTMTYKATVSNVSDKEYSGPYLSGKTQGGGNWEAQLYK